MSTADRLGLYEMALLRRELAHAGIALNASLEANRELVELRRLYEPHVVALSKYLMISVPPWRVEAPVVYEPWRRSCG